MVRYVYDAAAAIRYDEAVPVRPGEVEFYLELAREAQERGLPTLELGVGTGRMAIPLAREGIDVVGLDKAPAMLARAREKSAELRNVRWVEEDMRSFDLREEFGFVSIPFGTFQALLTTEDQLACLHRIWWHLAPGGRVAFEVLNPNVVSMADWLTVKRGTFQRRPERDFVHPETGRQELSWISLDYQPAVQRLIVGGMTEELNEEGEVLRRTYSTGELRYLHRFEAEHLLARCGLEIEAVYEDFFKAEFHASAEDVVYVARRQA